MFQLACSFKSMTTMAVVSMLTACVSIVPAPSDALDELKKVGVGYGIVVGKVPADDEDTRRVCHDGTEVAGFTKYCGRLSEYEVLTVNVAATSSKSFLKVLLVVPITSQVRNGDIVKFQFGELPVLAIASRGETPSCKWSGSSPLSMGFPGQVGGIECDSWSYKSLLHVNWRA